MIQSTIQSCHQVGGSWFPVQDDEVTRQTLAGKIGIAALMLFCQPGACGGGARQKLKRLPKSWRAVPLLVQMQLRICLKQNLRRCVDRLLSRDQMARMLESLRSTEPATVEQTVPDVVSVATVQRTLQCLLREGLPIKPLAVLLEAIADHASEGHVCQSSLQRNCDRPHIDRTIVRRLRDNEGRLTIIEVTPRAAELTYWQLQNLRWHHDWNKSDYLLSCERALRPSTGPWTTVCNFRMLQKDRGSFCSIHASSGHR